MRAETLWKAFAILAALSLVFDAAALDRGSVLSVANLLFHGLCVVGLIGFAWNRAFLIQKVWKTVVFIQLALVSLSLVQLLIGAARFSDPVLLMPLLQVRLITTVISGLTLIGLFMYAWSPMWYPEQEERATDV